MKTTTPAADTLPLSDLEALGLLSSCVTIGERQMASAQSRTAYRMARNLVRAVRDSSEDTIDLLTKAIWWRAVARLHRDRARGIPAVRTANQNHLEGQRFRPTSRRPAGAR